jgi:transposase
MSYSKDFKLSAVTFRTKGHSLAEVEEAYGIGRQTLGVWQKAANNGTLGEKKIQIRKPRKINLEELKKVVEERPDLYLPELAKMFECSTTAVQKRLDNLNITLKKRRLPIPKNPKKSEQNFSNE